MNKIKTIISLTGICQSAIKWRLTDICNYQCSYCIRKQFGTSNNTKLKEDVARIEKASLEVARIIKELPGYVKLDLIGGEVSLFNLHKILTNMFELCGDKLKRINITTNMSQSTEYYNDLVNLCDSYGSEIGITCSWHSEFISLEDFIEKFDKIKSPNQKGIRIECVSRINNTKEIEKLVNICKNKNYSYFIEKDLTASSEEKESLIAESSSSKKDRYKVVYENGEQEFYKARNHFLTSKACDSKIFIESKGYYCSRDYDYVYIEIDKHMGRNNEIANCKTIQDIKDFHPLKTPIRCQNTYCTLCGQISISEKMEELIKNDK